MPEPSADRLALVYRVSQAFNSSLELDEVLARVMDGVIAATQAERGFLMLRDAGGRLAFRAARGLEQKTVEAPEYEISRGLVERVAETGEPVLTTDALSDTWLQTRQSVVGLRLRSILCVPLRIKSEIRGAIYVENRLKAGMFSTDDLELLQSIAASAAVAIENARLYQVAVEKGRLEQELQMARQVQASLLPREIPRLSGWEFAARWLPAREVAGDFYDFIPGEGSLGLLVADVTDKGMPAALFMAHTRSVIRANVDLAAPLADGLTRANRQICADDTRGMFVTLCFARLGADNGEIQYVNAGHNPPMICRAGMAEIAQFERTGIPLGVEASLHYSQKTAVLDAGDCVLFFTDGVTDAVNAEEEEFGEARLSAVLLEHRQSAADAILEAIVQAVNDFIGATDPYDDVTLLIAKRV